MTGSDCTIFLPVTIIIIESYNKTGQTTCWSPSNHSSPSWMMYMMSQGCRCWRRFPTTEMETKNDGKASKEKKGNMTFPLFHSPPSQQQHPQSSLVSQHLQLLQSALCSCWSTLRGIGCGRGNHHPLWCRTQARRINCRVFLPGGLRLSGRAVVGLSAPHEVRRQTMSTSHEAKRPTAFKGGGERICSIKGDVRLSGG